MEETKQKIGNFRIFLLIMLNIHLLIMKSIIMIMYFLYPIYKMLYHYRIILARCCLTYLILILVFYDVVFNNHNLFDFAKWYSVYIILCSPLLTSHVCYNSWLLVMLCLFIFSFYQLFWKTKRIILYVEPEYRVYINLLLFRI